MSEKITLAELTDMKIKELVSKAYNRMMDYKKHANSCNDQQIELSQAANYNAKNEDVRTIKKRGRTRNAEDYSRVIRLYDEGKSQAEISKIVNKPKSTIYIWIREYKAKVNRT